MLENEAGGPSGYKTYQPGVEDPAEAGALAVPLWELSLLAAHFHPHVAQVCVCGVGMWDSAGGRSKPACGGAGPVAAGPWQQHILREAADS